MNDDNVMTLHEAHVASYHRENRRNAARRSRIARGLKVYEVRPGTEHMGSAERKNYEKRLQTIERRAKREVFPGTEGMTCDERRAYKHRQRCRARRARLAAEMGRVYTPRERTPERAAMTPQERRREYKRQQRRKEGRAIRLHDGHVRCREKWFRTQWPNWRRRAAMRAALHDAHVAEHREELRRLRIRLKWHEIEKHRPTTAPLRIARRKRERDELQDAYVVRLLNGNGTNGVKSESIPQSLIDLKREQLRLVRLLNDLKGDEHDEERRAVARRVVESVR